MTKQKAKEAKRLIVALQHKEDELQREHTYLLEAKAILC
jgi:hypothetical protein